MSVVRDIRPARLAEPVVLCDGSIVHLRALRGDDEASIRSFLEGVSPESLRRRFCGATDLARAARSLIDGGGADDFALVAHEAPTSAIVAHAGSFRIDARRAEVAFLVADSWQGRGLGTLMLSRLAEAAEQQGITTLVADVLPHNRAMIAVFQRSGYPVEARWDAQGVEVEIDLTSRMPSLARAA